MEDVDGRQRLRGLDEARQGTRVAEVCLDGGHAVLAGPGWDSRLNNVGDDDTVFWICVEERGCEALADEAGCAGDEDSSFLG